MKLGIMQPYFFPYIGYWQLINAVDKYVIYDDVNFIKNGWICRNRILMNGTPHYFSLHTFGASSNLLINEVRVSSDKVLRNKMLKTLRTCYGKAPYFQDVYPLVEEILIYEEDNLARFLTNSITKVCSYIGVDTEIIVSSSIKKDNTLKGQQKVLQICNIIKVKEYINAVGGQSLYSKEDFLKNKVELKFLISKPFLYKQFKTEFLPDLSIIDVMMFNSKSEIKEILMEYKLL